MTLCAVVLLLLPPPEPYPEVSIRGQEAPDEGFNQSLLCWALDAHQMSPISSAGQVSLLVAGPAGGIVEINDFVAGFLCPTPANRLPCREGEKFVTGTVLNSTKIKAKPSNWVSFALLIWEIQHREKLFVLLGWQMASTNFSHCISQFRLSLSCPALLSSLMVFLRFARF